MRRAALLFTFSCLLGCNGGDIAVFSARGGTSGAGTSALGGAGAGGLVGSGGLDCGGAGAAQAGDSGSNSAGQGGSNDPPCRGSLDCPSSFYCSKPSCPDSQGACLPRPFPDAGLEAPVCGCDGLTYWNDNLRQRYGVAASTPGPCTSMARPCDFDKDCGSMDARCPHLLPPDVSCGPPPGPGTCWVTPIDCSPSDSAEYQVCPPPGSSGGAPPCVTKCQALQSRHPFMQVSKTSCP